MMDDMMTLQKAIQENADSNLRDIKLGLNQFTDKEFRDHFSAQHGKSNCCEQTGESDESEGNKEDSLIQK